MLFAFTSDGIASLVADGSDTSDMVVEKETRRQSFACVRLQLSELLFALKYGKMRIFALSNWLSKVTTVK